MNTLALEEVREGCFHLRLVGYVAGLRGRRAPCSSNHFAGRRGGWLAYVQDANNGSMRRKLQRDRLPNAASAAGDDGHFAVEPECPLVLIFAAHSETPRFQGMKSS